MTPRRHNTAFTLLELVLLLLIMAVVSTIAAPSLQNFGRGRMLPNTATEFISATQWARAQAISEGYSHRLNIDPVAGRWSVSKDDGSGTNFVEYTDGFGKPFTLPDGVSVETTVPAVDNRFTSPWILQAARTPELSRSDFVRIPSPSPATRPWPLITSSRRANDSATKTCPGLYAHRSHDCDRGHGHRSARAGDGV